MQIEILTRESMISREIKTNDKENEKKEMKAVEIVC